MILTVLLFGGLGLGAYLYITRKGTLSVKAVDPTEYPVLVTITQGGTIVVPEEQIAADKNYSLKQGRYSIRIVEVAAGGRELNQDIELKFPDLKVTLNFDLL